MYWRIFITLLHLVLLQQICKIFVGNEKLFEVDEQVCNCVHQEEEQTTPVSMGLGKWTVSKTTEKLFDVSYHRIDAL